MATRELASKLKYEQANTTDADDESNDDDWEDEPFDSSEEEDHDDPPAVRALMLPFMFMFQGYGAMVGIPQHALKEKLDLPPDQAGAFQDAAATFQLAKLVMRIAQIAFLVFVQPNGIVYLSYLVMLVAVMVPVVFVWWGGVTGLWVVYLQYILGGVAIGLFEGTYLSVISACGKDTKTFAIMGAPLGFAVHNIVLGTFSQFGMPPIVYYLYTAFCLPFAALIFHKFAPAEDPKSKGKGCQVFFHSLRHCKYWLPKMIPWFIAKFIGNFVLEDGFPLLFNVFNTKWVPLFGGPGSETTLIPFAFYTAWLWFPSMALGDTISRRLPQYVTLRKRDIAFYLTMSIVFCIGGEAMNFLLLPLVTVLAAFISNFGNGFIYGLTAKFIDGYIPLEHRYTSYNLWCFVGDLGGYAGQGSLSVELAHQVCAGRHYKYVCHTKTPTLPPTPPPAIANTSV